MAADKKAFGLTVHRAIIHERFEWSLAEILQQVKDGAKPSDLVVRRALFDRAHASFPAFPQTNTAVAATFALYEEGLEMSTLKASEDAQGYATSPHSAPEGSHYVGNEVAILVEGNYMVACNLGNRQSLLIEIISKLAHMQDIDFPPGCMSFATIPNQLTVEKIRQVGVKSVKFDASNLLGSLETDTKNVVSRVFGGLYRDKDLDKMGAIADLHLRLSKKKQKALGYDNYVSRSEWLDKAAEQAFEDEDVGGCTIILADGKEYKNGDLKLRTKVQIKMHGSSFQVPEAIGHMLEYLKELQSSGDLE